MYSGHRKPLVSPNARETGNGGRTLLPLYVITHNRAALPPSCVQTTQPPSLPQSCSIKGSIIFAAKSLEPIYRRPLFALPIETVKKSHPRNFSRNTTTFGSSEAACAGAGFETMVHAFPHQLGCAKGRMHPRARAATKCPVAPFPPIPLWFWYGPDFGKVVNDHRDAAVRLPICSLAFAGLTVAKIRFVRENGLQFSPRAVSIQTFLRARSHA